MDGLRALKLPQSQAVPAPPKGRCRPIGSLGLHSHIALFALSQITVGPEKTALKAGAKISSCALKCYQLSYDCWVFFK